MIPLHVRESVESTVFFKDRSTRGVVKLHGECVLIDNGAHVQLHSAKMSIITRHAYRRGRGGKPSSHTLSPQAGLTELEGVEERAPRTSTTAGLWLLLALICLSAGAKAVLFDTLDPDCFWHMRVAQQIEREGVRPVVDHISFAARKEAWTPYSWLAEIAMERLWRCGGYRAAIATQALMAAAIVLLIGLSGREISNGQALSSAVAAAGGAFLSLAYLSFRPVTLAILLMALCAWLLVRDRRSHERSRAVWAVVPITVILANVHLYALLMPAWLVALWLSAIIERHGRSIRRYGAMLALTAAACLATPMLKGMWTTAIYYQFHDPMVHSTIIAEMQPFMHGAMGKVSGLLVLAFFIVTLLNRRKLRAGEWIWLLGSTLLLLRWGRFAPVFALVAAPALAACAGLSDRVLGRRLIVAVMTALLALGAWHVAQEFPRRDTKMSAWLNRHGPDAPGYPCAAADYLLEHVPPHTEKIITDFTWGGYVGWRLGEPWQVLLDGRTQVYPAELWQATYLGTEADRLRFLASITADAAILPHKSVFHPALKKLGWQMVFSDAYAEVLLPSTPDSKPNAPSDHPHAGESRNP